MFNSFSPESSFIIAHESPITSSRFTLHASRFSLLAFHLTMPQLLNQNSYTFAALIIFVAALASVLVRYRRARYSYPALAALALALIAGNFIFRVGVSEIESAAQFDQLLAARQPLVLEIFSNY